MLLTNLSSRMKIKRITQWSVDFLLFPLLIVVLTYNPIYKHGILLSWDKGGPLSWSNAVMLGQVPFKDVYINFGPVFVYLSVFFMKLFGNTLAVQRGFIYFGTILSLILAYFLARKLITNRILLIILCWFISMNAVMPFWMSRWGGIRNAIIFITLIFIIFYNETKRLLYLLIAGISAALCFSISQEMGLLSIVLFISFICYKYFASRNSGIAFSSYLKEITIFLLAFISIIIAVYLYLILKGATLENILINLVKIPLEFTNYYRNPPVIELPSLRFSFREWVIFLCSPSFDIFFAPILYIISFTYLINSLKRKHRDLYSENLVLMLVTVYGLFMYIIGIRGFSGPKLVGPQFRFSLLATGIIGIFFMQRISLSCKDISYRQHKFSIFIKSISLFLLFISIFYLKLPLYSSILKQQQNKIIEDKSPVPATKLGDSILPFQQYDTFYRVSDFIIKHTSWDEYIYAFPHEPRYYFLTQRRCPTFFTNALDAGIAPAFQLAAIKDIESKKLNFAILVSDSYLVTDNIKVPNEKRIPLIYNFLKDKFIPVKNINGTIILKRK